jgi:myo-inositol-1(or 4)-monophosphatase
MHPMLTIAVKAARRAGAIINRAALDAGSLEITRKRHNDFVTEVDHAAESAIIEIIRRAYPDHSILAEESGASLAEQEFTWIIDPLDGTTNFIHGYPQYSVSVAVRQRDTLAHGVIYDPARNELFVASRGRGAFLNDRRIRVTRRAKLDDALIGTGFPFRDMSGLDEYMRMFRAVITRVAGIRRAGSAALDLAYVAAGRFDGFWEIGLSPWDMAAGALLIQEAGGLVGELGFDLQGGPGYLDSGRIIGGNPKVFGQLLQLIGPLSSERGPDTDPGKRRRRAEQRA